MSGDPFVAGGVAALEEFLTGILDDRGRIENEVEPVFDVIVDLLERTITEIRSSADTNGPVIEPGSWRV